MGMSRGTVNFARPFDTCCLGAMHAYIVSPQVHGRFPLPWPVFPGCAHHEVIRGFGSAARMHRTLGALPHSSGVIASHVATQLEWQGCDAGEVRRLVRKARVVDGLSRFTRAAVVSLCTTTPVTLAAGAGALAGAAIGAPVGGLGALVGAPLGALAGACAAAPLAAALSTAMDAVEARHRRGGGREFTERVPRSPGSSRTINALAYAMGALTTNAPLTAAQGLASLGMAAGLSTTAMWGGVGLLAAPAIAIGATGVRVGLQEAFTTRVPGAMFGLSRNERSPHGVDWNPALMHQRLQRLRGRSTARLVMDDLQRFGALLRTELPHELRRAVQPGQGLGQTALNAALLIGGQALGQGAAVGANVAGAPGAVASAVGRLVQHGVGSAAWGAGRTVSKPAPKQAPRPARRPGGPAL